MSMYLFSWDDLSARTEARFKDFLIAKYDIDWVKDAKIEKIENDKGIQLSTEKDTLFLVLDDNKTEATLIIDDGNVDKLKVNTEDGKLKIYTNVLCPFCGENDLEFIGDMIKCANCKKYIKKTSSTPTDISEHWVTEREFQAQNLIDVALLFLSLIFPVITIYSIFLFINYLIIKHAFNIFGGDEINYVELIAQLIRDLTISMGLLDLASLVSRKYLIHILNNLIILGKRMTINSDYNNNNIERSLMESPTDNDSLKERKYISRLIAFTIIFILSHILCILLEPPENYIYYSHYYYELSYLVFATLFGSAAVLISIGLWYRSSLRVEGK